MERREEIEDAYDVETVEIIQTENQKRIDSLISDMSAVFHKIFDTQAGQSSPLLNDTLAMTIRLKYFNSIDQACKDKMLLLQKT